MVTANLNLRVGPISAGVTNVVNTPAISPCNSDDCPKSTLPTERYVSDKEPPISAASSTKTSNSKSFDTLPSLSKESSL